MEKISFDTVSEVNNCMQKVFTKSEELLSEVYGRLQEDISVGEKNFLMYVMEQLGNIANTNDFGQMELLKTCGVSITQIDNRLNTRLNALRDSLDQARRP